MKRTITFLFTILLLAFPVMNSQAASAPRLVDDADLLTPAEELDEEDEPTLIEVGEITDFLDIPKNPCIEVETENGAVMIPLHEDLILSVDPEYQEIIMQIPAGLI